MSETQEQAELRRIVRELLSVRASEADLRRAIESEQGYDDELWEVMATQLGLHGLMVPEAYGGSGAGFVELGIVLEEMGAALLGGPFLASAVLGAGAVLTSGDADAMSDLLPSIADGTRIATVAYLDQVKTFATPTVDGFALTGTKAFVLDGMAADLILVTARTVEGVSLFAVDSQAARLSRASLPTLDLTRRQATVTLEQTPGRLVGAEGAGGQILTRVLQFACVALACESVGAARSCLDAAVAHARQRYAFGRPIGSFQAIKHRCADMLVDVETARSAALHAARVADTDPGGLSMAAALAKAVCGDAAHSVARANIQIHGGVGFTWEHPAHLYFRRAKATQLSFGSSTDHRRALADLLGLGPAV
jgi:alkylation response protein AidB-like acyl-CoA dehydrogenase